jgi:SAM-dependent methyltransferase
MAKRDDRCLSESYLRDLKRINVLTLAYRPTLFWLKRAERPISVLDVGSGGGGMLRQLRARGKNFKLDLTGVDINPWSTRSSKESTPPEMSICFERADVLARIDSLRTDFIVSSSFTHHFGDTDVVLLPYFLPASRRAGGHRMVPSLSLQRVCRKEIDPSPKGRLGHDTRQRGPHHREPQRR